MGVALAALVLMLTQCTRLVLASRTVGCADGEIVTRKGFRTGCKVIGLCAKPVAAQKMAVSRVKERFIIKMGSSLNTYFRPLSANVKPPGAICRGLLRG